MGTPQPPDHRSSGGFEAYAARRLGRLYWFTSAVQDHGFGIRRRSGGTGAGRLTRTRIVGSSGGVRAPSRRRSAVLLTGERRCAPRYARVHGQAFGVPVPAGFARRKPSDHAAVRGLAVASLLSVEGAKRVSAVKLHVVLDRVQFCLWLVMAPEQEVAPRLLPRWRRKVADRLADPFGARAAGMCDGSRGTPTRQGPRPAHDTQPQIVRFKRGRPAHDPPHADPKTRPWISAA